MAARAVDERKIARPGDRQLRTRAKYSKQVQAGRYMEVVRMYMNITVC